MLHSPFVWTQECKYVLWSTGAIQCMPKVGTISWSRTITCLALIPCDVYKDKQTYLSHLVLVLLCNMILHPKAQHKLVAIAICVETRLQVCTMTNGSHPIHAQRGNPLSTSPSLHSMSTTPILYIYCISLLLLLTCRCLQ